MHTETPRQGRCLMPSSKRTRRMLLGNSSTPLSTNVRHSGHRSSPRDPTIPSRQRRQKVCWHGRTLAVASNRSRHTGHSRRSSRADSSMVVLGLSLVHSSCPLRRGRHILQVCACSPQLSCHCHTLSIVLHSYQTLRRDKNNFTLKHTLQRHVYLHEIPPQAPDPARP